MIALKVISSDTLQELFPNQSIPRLSSFLLLIEILCSALCQSSPLVLILIDNKFYQKSADQISLPGIVYFDIKESRLR